MQTIHYIVWRSLFLQLFKKLGIDGEPIAIVSKLLKFLISFIQKYVSNFFSLGLP